MTTTPVQMEMIDGLLTADERRRLSELLLNSTMAEVTPYLEEILGFSVNEFRESHIEAARIEREVEKWLASKKTGEYLRTDQNKQALLAYLGDRELPITAKNLETAWYDLMAAGKLEEPPGLFSNRLLVGQRDPAKSAFETVIRKSPAKMTASEFAEAIATSRSFRQKIDGMPVEMEFLRAPEDTQELRRRVKNMDSKTYQKWLEDPDNRQAVAALYSV